MNGEMKKSGLKTGKTSDVGPRPRPYQRGLGLCLRLRGLSFGHKFKAKILADWPTKFTFASVTYSYIMLSVMPILRCRTICRFGGAHKLCMKVYSNNKSRLLNLLHLLPSAFALWDGVGLGLDCSCLVNIIW